MKPITRRTMMQHSAVTAAAVSLAGGAAFSSPLLAATGQASPALFVFDARFDRSVALAESYARAGAILLDPREADLGRAWQGLIPSLLQQGKRIEGLTLWSDRLISEIFAREHAVIFRAEEISAGRGSTGTLQQWWLA